MGARPARPAQLLLHDTNVAPGLLPEPQPRATKKEGKPTASPEQKHSALHVSRRADQPRERVPSLSPGELSMAGAAQGYRERKAHHLLLVQTGLGPCLGWDPTWSRALLGPVNSSQGKPRSVKAYNVFHSCFYCGNKPTSAQL